MTEDFVIFELAKKLKEKGFYYKCVSTYDNDGMLGYNYIQPTSIRAIGFDDCLCSHNVENDGCIDAPTIPQALKWLREEKKLHIGISPQWQYTVYDMRCSPWIGRSDMQNYDDYTKAAIAGIEYCLDNLI